MIAVQNIKIWGFEAAIRGMRNPMNSWDKSDSSECNLFPTDIENCKHLHRCPRCNFLAPQNYCIGDKDIDLMKRLFKGGTEHRKYLRMIHVTMDIIAPLYWWKEFDTYKVGTVANSCSTMHKIAAKEFEASDFSNDKLGVESQGILQGVIGILNQNRKDYLETKDKFFWWQIIQLLPSSYNQRRTVDFDYEIAFSIIRQRTGHKLDEWNEFVNVLIDLPYMKDIGDLNGKTETVCD